MGPPPGMAPPSSNANASERPGANPLRQPELLRSLFDEAFRCNVGASASADPGRAESRAQCVDLIVRAVTDGGEDEVAEAVGDGKTKALLDQLGHALLPTLMQVKELGVTRCGASGTPTILDPLREQLSLPSIELSAPNDSKTNPNY